MNGRVYKSSSFDRILFSLISAGVLMPGLWVILYGIEKRSYNWPMAAAGLLMCSYAIYILQKFFLYKVTLFEDSIEIQRFDKTITVRYEDIIYICCKRNACYIIDRVFRNGKYYVRGTKPPVLYKENTDKIKVSITKLPVLQRAFMENYDQVIQYISQRSGIILKSQKKQRDRRSSFASAALLKRINYMHLDGMDMFKMFVPYLILLLTFLMCLAEYGVVSKGNYSPELTVYIRLIFPVLVILAIYILFFNFIHYLKRLLGKSQDGMPVSTMSIIIFIVLNFVLSAIVIITFFMALNNIAV